MSNKIVSSLSLAIGAALLGSVGLANAASAFAVNDLGQGYMLVGDEKPEGKCGEGKCGADKAKEAGAEAGKQATEGSCGEGKCGADKGKEGSCGEGHDKAAAEGEDKGKEGSCGGSA